jgi:hypothetical protein
VGEPLGKMFLVTTAIKKSFPENTDEEVLFLREWCKIYNQKDLWKDFNSKPV